MKKYVISAFCGFSSALAVTAAFAQTEPAQQTNWYTGISGDLTWPNHADTGGGGNIELGIQLAPTNYGKFRVEAEAGYHGADGDNGYGHIRYFNYMGNVYYDFSQNYDWFGPGLHISPYIGAGIGDAAIHRGNDSFNNSLHHHYTDEFAYQGMAGLAFSAPEMPRTEWTVGYRYMGTSENDDIKLHANNVELGLRYHF